MDSSDRFTFSLANVMLAMMPLAAMIGLTKGGLETSGPVSTLGLGVALVFGPPLLFGALLGGRRGMRDAFLLTLIVIGIALAMFVIGALVPMLLVEFFRLIRGGA